MSLSKPSVFILTVTAALLIGCGGAQQVREKIILVPGPPVNELKKPPPEPGSWQMVGPEGGCPEEFAWCAPPRDAAAITRTLEELLQYAAESWATCGPTPEPDPEETAEEE